MQSSTRYKIFRIAAYSAVAFVILLLILFFTYTPKGVKLKKQWLSSTAVNVSAETIRANTNIVTSAPNRSTTPSNMQQNNGVLENIITWVADNEIEFCGMTAIESVQFLRQESQNTAETLKPAFIETIAPLAQSNDAEKQAQATFLRSLLDYIAAQEKAQPVLLHCKEDERCRDAINATLKLERQASLAPLVALATATTNPNIYAMAVHACSSHSGQPCAAISAERWVQIDADNAMAWLTLANTSTDTALRDAALLKAAAAPLYLHRIPQIAPLLQSEKFQSLPPLVQLTTTTTALAMQAAWASTHYTSALRYCRVNQATAESHKQTCDALALKIAENDHSTIGLHMAITIAKFVGWDATRIQALSDESLAIQAFAANFANGEKPYSCAGLEAQQRFIKGVLSNPFGERGNDRALIAASGKTVAEVAAAARISNRQ